MTANPLIEPVRMPANAPVGIYFSGNIETSDAENALNCTELNAPSCVRVRDFSSNDVNAASVAVSMVVISVSAVMVVDMIFLNG